MKSSFYAFLVLALLYTLVAGDSTARTTFIVAKESEQKQSVSLQVFISLSRSNSKVGFKTC